MKEALFSVEEALECGAIFETHATIAREIVADISKKKASKLIQLFAPMQSGKTKAILATALEALAKNVVDKVYITCGENSLDLFTQNGTDLKRHIDIVVLKRREFGKQFKDLLRHKRTLFIIDESHFADLKNGELDKGNVLSKLVCHHRRTGPFLCLISATPFNHDNYSGDVKVYSMMPGATYNSVQSLLNKNQIIDLNYNPCDKNGTSIAEGFPLWDNLASLSRSMRPNDRSSYVIVRTPNSNCNQKLIEYIARLDLPSVVCREWTGKPYDLDTENGRQLGQQGSLFIKGIREGKKLGQLYVIFVNQFARMGLVLDTKCCVGMYDYVGLEQGVSTLLQSFIGRACGYQNDDMSLKQNDIFPIYTCKRVAEIYAEYQHDLEAMRRAFTDSGFYKFTANARGSKKERPSYLPALIAIPKGKTSRATKFQDVLRSAQKLGFEFDPTHYLSMNYAAVKTAFSRIKNQGTGFSYGHEGSQKLRPYDLDETPGGFKALVTAMLDSSNAESESILRQLKRFRKPDTYHFYILPIRAEYFEQQPEKYKALFNPLIRKEESIGRGIYLSGSNKTNREKLK